MDDITMDDVFNGDYEAGEDETVSQDDVGFEPESGGYETEANDNITADDYTAMDAVFDGTAEEESQESVGGYVGDGMPSGGAEDSSPYMYSSIARALTEEGILNLPNIDAVHDAASLRAAFDREIEGRMSPIQQRVNWALNYGMQPTEIQQYEQALRECQSYDDNAIADESDDGVDLRRNLIYQGCLARGMNEQQANREVEKSFKAGTDLEDARDARDFVTQSISARYQQAMEDGRQQSARRAAEQDRRDQSLYNSIVNDDGSMFGNLSETLKKQAVNNYFGRVRMPDGKVVSPIVAASVSNPQLFEKAILLTYTLTDGFRNFDRLGQMSANKSIKRGIAGLERALKGGGAGGGGAYKYANNADGRNDGDYDIVNI